MNKLKFSAVMLGVMLCAAPADAQGFLNKAKEKMEKAKQQVEKVSKEANKVNKTAQEGTSVVTSSSRDVDPETGKKTNLYPNLVKGSVNWDKKKSLHTVASTVNLEATTDHFTLGNFYDGMALVSLDGKAPCFINKKGEKLKLDIDLGYLEYVLEDLWPRFDKGRVLLKNGNDVVIVDKSGKIVKTFTGDIVGNYGFEDGVGMIEYNKGGKYVVEWIDTDGNSIYPDLADPVLQQHFIHSRPRMLREGMRAYKKYDPDRFTDNWGFVDANGKWVVAPEYAYVRDFHDGLAAVLTHGADDVRKWGFIDKTGKLVIDCKFSKEPGDFDSGYAVAVNRAGNAVVIDKTGKSVFEVPEQWDITNFMNGYAILEGYETHDDLPYQVSYAVTDGGQKKVAYETDGFVKTTVMDPATGTTYYIKDGEIGIIDIPTMTTKSFGLRDALSDGVAKVDDGYVNADGEYVIKIGLSEF